MEEVCTDSCEYAIELTVSNLAGGGNIGDGAGKRSPFQKRKPQLLVKSMSMPNMITRVHDIFRSSVRNEAHDRTSLEFCLRI